MNKLAVIPRFCQLLLNFLSLYKIWVSLPGLAYSKKMLSLVYLGNKNGKFYLFS